MNKETVSFMALTKAQVEFIRNCKSPVLYMNSRDLVHFQPNILESPGIEVYSNDFIMRGQVVLVDKCKMNHNSLVSHMDLTGMQDWR